MADHEILILQMGDPRYEGVFARIRADRDLLADMWTAAESELVEHPDKVWIIAVDPAGRALAWCAYEPTDERGATVKCVDSYERPESWDDDLYAVVYAARHELTRGHDCVTYVFPEPMELHLADGWIPVDEGDSAEEGVPTHHWTCLVRAAA